MQWDRRARQGAVYSARCALPQREPDVFQDTREVRFEVLLAGITSVGDSREVFAHAADVEVRRELQQALGVDSICSRVSVILKTFLANRSSTLTPDGDIRRTIERR